MLRLLENGFKVQMVPTSCLSQPVDSIEDIKIVEKLMTNDLKKVNIGVFLTRGYGLNSWKIKRNSK